MHNVETNKSRDLQLLHNSLLNFIFVVNIIKSSYAFILSKCDQMYDYLWVQLCGHRPCAFNSEEVLSSLHMLIVSLLTNYDWLCQSSC